MGKFKQSTVCRTLAISITVIGIILLISGIMTIRSLKSMLQYYAAKSSVSNAADELYDGLDYQAEEMQAYAQFADKARYDNFQREVQESKRVDSALRKLDAIVAAPAQKELLGQIAEYNTQMIAFENQAAALVDSGQFAQARMLLFDGEYAQMNAAVHEMVATVTGNVDKSITDLVNQESGMVLFLSVQIVVGTIILVVLQFLNMLYTNQCVLLPIMKLRDAMQVVSKGNLSGKVKVERGPSEIGQLTGAIIDTKQTLSGYIEEISQILGKLAEKDFVQSVHRDYTGDFAPIKRSLNVIIDSLNVAFSSIGQAVSQVSSGSGQVSSGAQALSQGAAEQASAVQQLSATINEITTQVSENAQSARDASGQAQNVGVEIGKSNGQMHAMMQAMQEINQSANEIGRIIKNIEDIAFQTNILALNAAVEAARAGAAGKGFAVVADEVRSLAQKSAEASQNTAALIENSVRAVEHGTGIAKETAESMAQVVDAAQTVIHTIGKISEVSAGQAESLAQVTVSVDQISSVVQTNSATAEQSAAASEELSSQAQLLQNLLAGIRLKEDAARAIKAQGFGGALD